MQLSNQDWEEIAKRTEHLRPQAHQTSEAGVRGAIYCLVGLIVEGAARWAGLGSPIAHLAAIAAAFAVARYDAAQGWSRYYGAQSKVMQELLDRQPSP